MYNCCIIIIAAIPWERTLNNEGKGAPMKKKNKLLALLLALVLTLGMAIMNGGAEKVLDGFAEDYLAFAAYVAAETALIWPGQVFVIPAA